MRCLVFRPACIRVSFALICYNRLQLGTAALITCGIIDNMAKFDLASEFKPTGDQPQAIEQLSQGFKDGLKYQTLLGVTGSGKTFTMANMIRKVEVPTLIISHNKTLAAQLAQEFREFFPNNAVEYFVSYYDYYQPEAYIPHTDTYIEKETEINETIDKMRLSTTTSLMTRKDVIVVASVSCIYNIGSPVEYGKAILELRRGMKFDMKNMLKLLSHNLLYVRSDFDFKRATFRVRGDTVDVYPAYSDTAVRVSFLGDKVEEIAVTEPISNVTLQQIDTTTIYPAKHYVTPQDTMETAIKQIEEDLEIRLEQLQREKKEIEAFRLRQRTMYDLEMIKEFGFCNGIENYSRYFDGRKPGETPYTLLNYFPKDYLLIIDESHITIPQIRGMYYGDRSRKGTLIDYGFRLPSALDNRPLRFEEFTQRVNQAVFTSATPDEWELSMSLESAWQKSGRKGLPPVATADVIPAEAGIISSDEQEELEDFRLRGNDDLGGGNDGVNNDTQGAVGNSDVDEHVEQLVDGVKPIEKDKMKKQIAKLNRFNELLRQTREVGGVVEQLIRPTGLVDPPIEVRKTEGQIPNLMAEIEKRVANGQRVLVTTLTKRMAEELSQYLEDKGIKVTYLHADIETLKRTDILDELRKGKFDVLVGINLLREGLDLPEVSLVAILDADKEGYLRSRTSLIQIMGRAARHVEGAVIMYADAVTGSMQAAIDEVNRRREIQIKYNQDHGITPQSIKKAFRERLIEVEDEEAEVERDERVKKAVDEAVERAQQGTLLADDKEKLLRHLQREMREAAKAMEFEKAARIRDKITDIQNQQW